MSPDESLQITTKQYCLTKNLSKMSKKLLTNDAELASTEVAVDASLVVISIVGDDTTVAHLRTGSGNCKDGSNGQA